MAYKTDHCLMALQAVLYLMASTAAFCALIPLGVVKVILMFIFDSENMKTNATNAETLSLCDFEVFFSDSCSFSGDGILIVLSVWTGKMH